VEFRILGPLQVLDRGAEVALRSAKERALLAVLLLHAGTPVSRDRLIDELWGESPPPTAATALNVHVSQLRKTLARNGSVRIATRPPGYAIEVEPDQLDAARFEELVAAARAEIGRSSLDAASRLLRDALALWRGPALDGVALESTTRHEVARLDELRLGALMDRIDCDLALGLHEQLIGELEALVGKHPLQERLRGQLMLALYRADRQADALRAYRDARAAFVDELGIEPSPSLQRLEKAILNQDPSLEAPAPARSAAAPAKPSTRHRRGVAIAGVALAAIASVAVVVATRGHGSAAPVTIRPDSVAVVDPHTNAVVADIALHAWPAAIAFGGGSLWVATKNDTLLQIDPRRYRVTRTFGLATEPSTIAVDRRYVWVLSGIANTLVEFDGDTGTLVRRVRLTTTIRVGPFKGRVLRFPDPLRLEEIPNPDLAVGGGAAWIGFGFGVVARVAAKSGDVEQIAAGSSHGIAFGEGAVWSVSDDRFGPPASGTISRIDVRTRTVTELPMQGLATPGIWGIVARPGGVWAIDDQGKRALKVDPDLRRVTAVVPLDHAPVHIALGAGAVWTANNDGTLSRLDERTGAQVKTIALGQYPRKAYPVDLATGDGAVWVAVH
jgi:DNA-binding SARP family transcriptional activator/DNA-binding beta-propeller fold protein YncE